MTYQCEVLVWGGGQTAARARWAPEPMRRLSHEQSQGNAASAGHHPGPVGVDRRRRPGSGGDRRGHLVPAAGKGPRRGQATSSGHSRSRRMAGSWPRSAAPRGRAQNGPGELRFYDVAGRKLQGVVKEPAGLRAVLFTPDGKTIATSGHDNTVKIRDAATGAVRATLGGFEKLVDALAFGPEGKTLVTGCLDASVKLWDVASGREAAHVQRAQRRSVDRGLRTRWEDDRLGRQRPHGAALESGHRCAPAFAQGAWPAGRRRCLLPRRPAIASASADGTVKLWDVAQGMERATARAQGLAPCLALAFSPDGSLLATGSPASSGLVKLWDVATGQEQASWKAHDERVSTLASPPDGKTLASGGFDRQVKLWNVETRAMTAVLQGPDAAGEPQVVLSVAYSPDGKTVAAAGEGQTVELRDVASGGLRGQALRASGTGCLCRLFARRQDCGDGQPGPDSEDLGRLHRGPAEDLCGTQELGPRTRLRTGRQESGERQLRPDDQAVGCGIGPGAGDPGGSQVDRSHRRLRARRQDARFSRGRPGGHTLGRRCAACGRRSRATRERFGRMGCARRQDVGLGK